MKTNKQQTFFEGRQFIAKSNGQTAVWEVMYREDDKIHTEVVGIIPDATDVEVVRKGFGPDAICKVDRKSKYYQTKTYTKRAIAFLCSKLIVRPIAVTNHSQIMNQLHMSFGA